VASDSIEAEVQSQYRNTTYDIRGEAVNFPTESQLDDFAKSLQYRAQLDWQIAFGAAAFGHGLAAAICRRPSGRMP